MSEQDSNQVGSQEQAPQQQFVLQKIYVKDLSFESPDVPNAFRLKWEPNVNIELNSKGNQLDANTHEVVLGLTVTVKLEDKVIYLIEVQQAGIFGLTGFSEQEMGAMLGSYCPNLLYPFAREVISDIVTKAGFPQLLLAPVNFDAIYQDHLKRQQQASSNTDSIH